MNNIRNRLSRLEQRLIPQSPPVNRSEILPELRALFDELAPILEQSELFRKVLEDAKVAAVTPQNCTAFWVTLRELLLPHPALYHRMDELLRKQIKANEAAAAKQAVGK